MSHAPDPASLPLPERRRRARELRAHDDLLVEVLEPEQHLPGLIEPLGTARQVILAAAQSYWPDQSWKSTNGCGPPRHGDLHVKIASVIADEPSGAHSEGNFVCPAGVALRIGIFAIQVNCETERNISSPGPEAVIYVPLDLAPKLMEALQEQINYWRENPPIG